METAGLVSERFKQKGRHAGALFEWSAALLWWFEFVTSGIRAFIRCGDSDR